MNILYVPDCYSQQRQHEKPADVYPVRMAMEATYDRNNGHNVTWWAKNIEYKPSENVTCLYDQTVTEPRYDNFTELPTPDRLFTDAFNKQYQKYGNYKHNPATHMQVADGCWYGKCTFCVENGRGWQVRQVDDVIEEIRSCYRMGFKEIFDDSGTFPDGLWMKSFCEKKLISGLFGMKIGCNMRIGASVDFKLMKQAGFRMVLFGVESANQSTLDKIGKGTNAKDIIPTIKRASEAGLSPHIATMHGFPWESDEEELKTIKMVHYLLRKGYAKTAQASTFSNPGTRPDVVHPNVNNIYNVAYTPEFWINKIKDIKEWSDFTYLLKGIRKGIIHD